MALNPSSCAFAGTSDMYGLGIRIGFYLQWFAEIVATWIATDEVPGIRLSNSFFIASTFLALIIQTSEGNLKPVEIYITLLLTFGAYVYFVPLYLWRIVTGYRARLDPSRWPRVLNGKMFSTLNHGMVVGVAVFQLWFWLRKARFPGTDGCEEFGFFFTKLRLNALGFVIVNLLFYFFLVLCCLGSFFVLVGKAMNIIPEKEYETISEEKAIHLQLIQSAVNVIIAITVVAATELTIKWNHIQNISDVTSAGQLIPMVIGVGLLVRVFYVAWRASKDPEKPEVYDPSSKTDPGWGITPTKRWGIPLHGNKTIHATAPERMPMVGSVAPPFIQASVDKEAATDTREVLPDDQPSTKITEIDNKTGREQVSIETTKQGSAESSLPNTLPMNSENKQGQEIDASTGTLDATTAPSDPSRPRQSPKAKEIAHSHPVNDPEIENTFMMAAPPESFHIAHSDEGSQDPKEVEEEKPKPARQTRFAHPTTLHKAKAGEASHTRLPQRPWFSAGTTEEVDGNELQDESKDLAASKKDLREEIVRADIERYECNIRGGMVMAAAPARFVSFSGHREFRRSAGKQVVYEIPNREKTRKLFNVLPDNFSIFGYPPQVRDSQVNTKLSAKGSTKNAAVERVKSKKEPSIRSRVQSFRIKRITALYQSSDEERAEAEPLDKSRRTRMITAAPNERFAPAKIGLPDNSLFTGPVGLGPSVLNGSRREGDDMFENEA